MGAIRDMTNSFNIPFIIAGLSFIVSAVLYFVVMWLMHRQTKVEAKDTAANGELTSADVVV